MFKGLKSPQSILYIKLTEKSRENTVLSIFCFVESIVSVKRRVYNTGRIHQNILNRIFHTCDNSDDDILKTNCAEKIAMKNYDLPICNYKEEIFTPDMSKDLFGRFLRLPEI